MAGVGAGNAPSDYGETVAAQSSGPLPIDYFHLAFEIGGDFDQRQVKLRQAIAGWGQTQRGGSHIGNLVLRMHFETRMCVQQAERT